MLVGEEEMKRSTKSFIVGTGLIIAAILYTLNNGPINGKDYFVANLVDREIAKNSNFVKLDYEKRQYYRNLAIKLLSCGEWYVVNDSTVKPKKNSEKEEWVNLHYQMHPLASMGWVADVKENARVKFTIPTQELSEAYDEVGYDYYVCGGICICLYVCDPSPLIEIKSDYTVTTYSKIDGNLWQGVAVKCDGIGACDSITFTAKTEPKTGTQPVLILSPDILGLENVWTMVDSKQP